MNLGFWERLREEGRATGGNPTPCFTPPPICSHFSHFASKTRSRPGENGKKIPLDVSGKIQALLNPLFQENIANAALQKEEKQGEKSVYPKGIRCFPSFLHPVGFLGCRGFPQVEIFTIQRFLGCSDPELPPELRFSTPAFSKENKGEGFGSRNWGQ